MAKRSDKNSAAGSLGAGLLAAVVGFAVFWLIIGRHNIFALVVSIIGGLMLGVLAALVVFSRRAQKARLQPDRGPGRRGRRRPRPAQARLDRRPAIALTSNRTSSTAWSARPGIVLIGEGNPGRVPG